MVAGVSRTPQCTSDPGGDGKGGEARSRGRPAACSVQVGTASPRVAGRLTLGEGSLQRSARTPTEGAGPAPRTRAVLRTRPFPSPHVLALMVSPGVRGWGHRESPAREAAGGGTTQRPLPGCPGWQDDGVCPRPVTIPTPAGPALESGDSGRRGLGPLPGSGRWVTFEHRYQTVLESSREIQHCPVRCPQRPRCSRPEDGGPRWEGGLRAPPVPSRAGPPAGPDLRTTPPEPRLQRQVTGGLGP